jgi:hypothetical protein
MTRAKTALAQRARGTSQTEEPPKKEKKLGGVGFWLMFGLVVIKDGMDLILDGLMAVGMALIPTALGAPVGVAVAAAAWGTKFVLGLGVYFALYLYFTSHGTSSWSKGTAKRLVGWGFAIIAENIPFVGILPITTITFLLTVHIENATQSAGSGILGKVTRVALKKVTHI